MSRSSPPRPSAEKGSGMTERRTKDRQKRGTKWRAGGRVSFAEGQSRSGAWWSADGFQQARGRAGEGRGAVVAMVAAVAGRWTLEAGRWALGAAAKGWPPGGCGRCTVAAGGGVTTRVGRARPSANWVRSRRSPKRIRPLCHMQHTHTHSTTLLVRRASATARPDHD